ncbi:hypothetical protein EVB91_086 [Rhizobium phage RHph_I1_18]|nr:hypothetical protein EVB91_086 [Rhizobium phage RHph_I1_18]
MNGKLTDSNFLEYAASHYDAVFPDPDEFNEDLKRLVYIKRLFNSYRQHGELKERLILNHLIILYNMFGTHATQMLFLKLDGYESILKTFLIYLSRMPDQIPPVGKRSEPIISKSIPIDEDVIQRLIHL